MLNEEVIQPAHHVITACCIYASKQNCEPKFSVIHTLKMKDINDYKTCGQVFLQTVFSI